MDSDLDNIADISIRYGGIAGSSCAGEGDSCTRNPVICMFHYNTLLY